MVGAVDALDLEPVGKEIEQALWLRDRLDAKISKALRRFDADEAWSADGSLSLTSWPPTAGVPGETPTTKQYWRGDWPILR